MTQEPSVQDTQELAGCSSLVTDEMVTRGAEAIRELWQRNPIGPMTPMAMSRAALEAAAPPPATSSAMEELRDIPIPEGVKGTAQYIADALGVTPYSDIRPYIIQAVELAHKHLVSAALQAGTGVAVKALAAMLERRDGEAIPPSREERAFVVKALRSQAGAEVAVKALDMVCHDFLHLVVEIQGTWKTISPTAAAVLEGQISELTDRWFEARQAVGLIAPVQQAGVESAIVARVDIQEAVDKEVVQLEGVLTAGVEGELVEPVGDRAENTTDNPKSWIAWKRRAEAAEAALKASDDKLAEAVDMVRACEAKIVELYRAALPHANSADGNRFADKDETVIRARSFTSSIQEKGNG